MIKRLLAKMTLVFIWCYLELELYKAVEIQGPRFSFNRLSNLGWFIFGLCLCSGLHFVFGPCIHKNQILFDPKQKNNNNNQIKSNQILNIKLPSFLPLIYFPSYLLGFQIS